MLYAGSAFVDSIVNYKSNVFVGLPRTGYGCGSEIFPNSILFQDSMLSGKKCFKTLKKKSGVILAIV
jgi:hypothetical protein